MKWSWKIWEYDGVGIYIHATFVLLIVWIGLAYWAESQSLAATVEGVGFILTLFLCVLLHEMGHSVAAKRYGIRTRDITLYPIGGVAQLERIPENPRQEFVVALAGPAVNVAIAAGLYFVLRLTSSLQPVSELGVTKGLFLERVMVANIFLVAFNLLPAFPMDGGRALRAVLAANMDYSRATQVAAGIGQSMAMLFGLLGLLFNPILLFIAFFVWIGAGHEATATLIRHSLSNVSVASAMLTDFKALSPRDTLKRASELILAGSQVDFPVLEGEDLVGILTRKNLVKGLSEKGEDGMVSDFMETDFRVLHPYDMLDTALTQHQECECRTIPVSDGGQLRGILTMENIGEFLMIQAALKGEPPPPLPGV
jgi:Zn-dependent protease